MKLAGIFVFVFAFLTPIGNSHELRIYLDADQTHTPQAGKSIELGLRAALDELGGTLGGHQVEFVIRNHRGNTRRSRKNLEAFSRDPAGFAVFCGLHSPPVLSAREFIHENSILMIDPWAAAGPITRGDYDPHWIFRVSVDDTKAGGVISRYALDQFGSKTPHLLLERTGWGRSNERTMKEALAKRGIENVPVHWFDWGIRDSGAEDVAKSILKGGADAVLLVANAPEGRELMAALARHAEPGALAVASHWGIAGGSLARVYPASVASTLDLAVIQTRAVHVLQDPGERVRGIVTRAIESHPDLAEGGEIGAAVGFVHAFDALLILDAAVRQAGVQPDIRVLREATRLALEDLENPVVGLLRRYERPFASPRGGDVDAHEALGEEDLVMVPVDASGAMRSPPR